MTADSLSGGQCLIFFQAGFLISVLVFVSHDFELGRTWLAGGVGCQSHTGLIFLSLYLRLLTAELQLCCAVTSIDVD